MIAKEWRDVRWKFTIGAVLLLLILPIPTLFAFWYGMNPGEFYVAEIAVQEWWTLYVTYGGLILVILAAVLGVTLISGEVSQDTIFLLLSKPVGRTRLLLTKYGVSAGVLLMVALLGSIGIVISAAAIGYPLGSFSIVGVTLSTVLLWLGSLSILGVALFVSVMFRSVIGSVVTTALAVYLIFALPGFIDVLIYNFYDLLLEVRPPIFTEPLEKLRLPHYWSNESLYLGEGLAPVNFLVCLIAAALPLLAALWLFNRKAY